VSLVRNAWAFLVLGLCCVSACAENNQSMFVVGAIAPAKDTQAGTCTYDPVGTRFILTPRLDVALSNGYVASFAVENQLKAREDYQNARAESNTIVVNGADVRVVDGAEELDFFPTVASGSPVFPQHGRTAVPVQVMSPKAVEKLRASLKPGEVRQVVSYIKLTGKTLGNESVETGEYQFAMYVCNKCLITFPADSRNPANPVNNCDNRATLPKEATFPCALGQDEPIDCRLCSATNPACQPNP
jgi:hypothetical protein